MYGFQWQIMMWNWLQLQAYIERNKSIYIDLKYYDIVTSNKFTPKVLILNLENKSCMKFYDSP
jgi:hypothetical protein